MLHRLEVPKGRPHWEEEVLEEREEPGGTMVPDIVSFHQPLLGSQNTGDGGKRSKGKLGGKN